jgi:hypothetical protein
MEGDVSDAEIIEESTSSEVVLPPVYMPTMMLNSEQAIEHARQLRELIGKVFEEGVDFGKVGKAKKPTLLKPGAEWGMKVFGLGHEFEIVETEWTQGSDTAPPTKWGITYRCKATKTLPSGVTITVGTCDGHASRDEDNFKKVPWNTIVKMSQKRAFVGVALQATGLSGSFTQDIEDDPNFREGVILDATPLLELLTDEQRAALRAYWKSRGWPAPNRLSGFHALEVAFTIGQFAVLSPDAMFVVELP